MKKLLVFLAALTVLAALALIVLAWNINPILEKAKPKLVQAISDAVKQPVELGELDVQFFPHTGVRVAEVKLAKGEAGSMTLKSLVLRTNLFKLIGGEINVTEFSLEQPQISIVKNPDGSMSVGGIVIGGKKAAPQEQANEAPGTTAGKQAKAEQSNLKLDIQQARISDGSITFLDLSVKPEKTINISDLNLRLSDIDSSGKGTLSLTASLLGTSKENLKVDGRFDLKDMNLAAATAKANLELNDLDLPTVMQLANSYGTRVEGLNVKEAASTEMEISLKDAKATVQGSLTGSSASISFKELFSKPSNDKLTVYFNATANLDAETKKVTKINADKLEITLGANTIDLATALTPGKAGQSTVKAQSFDLSDLSNYVSVIKPYSITGSVSPNFTVTLPIAKAPLQLKGSAKLNGIALKAPLPAKEGQAASQIDVSGVTGDLQFKKNIIDVENLNLEIEKQALEATASITGLPKPQEASFNVTSKEVKLHGILSKLQPEGQGFENSFLSNLKIIGSYALNSGQGEILLELGKSQLKNLPLDRLNLDVATTKNVIKINSSNVSLFGGNILAQGGLKTKEQTFAFKGSANGIDLGNLSTTLAPQAPVSVSGTLKDTAFKVSGATNSMPASLEGPVDASIIKGAINGVGIVGEALSQINKLPGLSGDNLSKAVQEEHKAALSRDKTEFDLLSVRLSLENGKIIISDLQLQHPLYIISGQGTVGFNGRIDLATQLKLTSVLAEGMMLKEPKLRLLLDANGNLVFPVLVKKEGSIPVVIPDVSQLLTRAAKNTAKEAARRELEKVAPGLGGAAGVIDSLFK